MFRTSENNQVEVVSPTTDTNIDAGYDDAVRILSTNALKSEPKLETKEENNRSPQTGLLLAWVLSNVLVT